MLGRSVNIGQTLQASFNTPTIFTIAKDITKMQVQAKVDEADIGNVVKGLRATFTVDAFIDDTFNGTVREVRLQPSISANVVTYSTLIDAPNDDKKLKPGMTANIVIYTKEVNDASLISVQALKFNPDSALKKQYEIIPAPEKRKGGRMGTQRNPKSGSSNTTVKSETVTTPDSYVWILQDNKLIQKKIQTGLNDNTHVQVLGGLNGNEVIVTGTESVAAANSAAVKSPFMPQRPGGRKR
ncbi:efflux RND transporter periplasmic adaptor subunit [Pedobacter sp. NJ-S-72]